MKAQVGAFNQKKALVGAFSVIVQLHRLIDLRHYSLAGSMMTGCTPEEEPHPMLLLLWRLLSIGLVTRIISTRILHSWSIFYLGSSHLTFYGTRQMERSTFITESILPLSLHVHHITRDKMKMFPPSVWVSGCRVVV